MIFINLPLELINEIALKAGFRGTLCLGMTCKYLYNNLLGPDSNRLWRDYKNLTSDHICIDVPVETRVHRFDHFVFGQWDDFSDSAVNAAGRHRQDSAVVLKPPGEIDSKKKLTLFMQHESMNRRSELDYLGGMAFTFSSTEPNIVKLSFFESPRHLPCYLQDWYSWKARARESVQSPQSVSEKNFNHSCEQCSIYDKRIFMSNLFYFNRRVLKTIPLENELQQFERLESPIDDPRSPLASSELNSNAYKHISEDVCVDWTFTFAKSWLIRILVHDSNHFNPTNLETKIIINNEQLNKKEVELFKKYIGPCVF